MVVADAALVVEDAPALRSSLMFALEPRARVVRGAGSVIEAVRLLDELAPDLVVLDVVLPDGTAFDVLRRAATLSPAPRVVAISGCAEPEATFRLAELGVRAFVPKPVRADALHAAVDVAFSRPPDLAQHLRASVGLRPIFEVEEEVRRTMVSEALARADGSKRKAARLLSVSRQLLQHILRQGLA